MVTAKEAFLSARKQLQAADIPDAGFEAELLLRQAAGLSRFDLDPLSAEALEHLDKYLQRRVKHEPLQYILGSWSFRGLELAVGRGVLIPRPETEWVCEAALDCIQGVGKPVVIDLCAGSGALALGIQQVRLDADVTAVELSGEAWPYLIRNIKTFQKSTGATPEPLLADVLEAHIQFDADSVDLIVSNPPYVTAEEYADLQPELYHEPKEALVAEDEGLQFYRAIARDWQTTLKSGRWLVFEIGARQGKAVLDIFQQNNYEACRIEQDPEGLDRIALGRKK